MRPFFSFYGGKWRDTPRFYPPPRYDTIIEPFAGSAGYATRYPDRNVILCDTDPVIARIWEYLVVVEPDEIRSLPDIPPGQTTDDLDVPDEARWLIGFCLNHGVTAPRRRPSAWMRAGHHDSSFWGPEIRERIASQVGGIRHWRVVRGDYRLLWDVEATWFVDPPYVNAGRHYRFGPEGIDYEDLGTWCRSRSGQVIVCEQEGAEWLPFGPPRSAKTARASRSHEVIWTND